MQSHPIIGTFKVTLTVAAIAIHSLFSEISVAANLAADWRIPDLHL